MIGRASIIATQCTHCGLPVPVGLIQPNRAEQFCCSGCSGAYELIHGSGLDSYYRMTDSESPKRSISQNGNTASRFGEFDELVFLEKYANPIRDIASRLSRDPGSGSPPGNSPHNAAELEMELAIEGVHCGACVWLLEKLPVVVPGVVDATVNWTKRTIRVRWRISEVKLSTIAASLNQLGYPPSPIQPNHHQERWKRENRKHLTQIGIAAACAGNNMLISLALYLGMFSHMTIGMTNLLRIASCVVGMGALLWPGRIFLQSALGAMRTRTPHMDLPIALGLSVGTVAGLVNVIRGTGEIYFDSLSVLIFLLLIGRWIQFRQQSIAANAVEMLYQLTPQKTRILVDGTPVETMVDLVMIDDLLQIRAGDLFPVDGEIVNGRSRVDESILTGESSTIEKNPGDEVAAGTLNVNSVLLMKATAIGHETRLRKIVDLVEQASMDKPKLVVWANQIGGYFVTAVIALALFTFGWWFTVDTNVAIERSIALLIVACPCALALATPLAIAVAIGRAAGQKIMIKGGDVLQSLQRPGMIWLDKTGTLTDRDLQIERWYGDTNWLDRVAALESQFSHPVANAFVRFKKMTLNRFDRLAPHKLSKFDTRLIETRTLIMTSEEHPGLGVSGVIGSHDVVVGNRRLLASLSIVPKRHQIRLSKRIIERGFSPCWIAVNGNVVGLAAIGDSIRPEAASAIECLRGRGWQVGILSGDHQQVVDRVAKRLAIDARNSIGGAEPETKLEVVNSSSASGNVVMIGDGVNDSAALAAATVGIAVKNGAEASLAAAPVYLAQPGLNPVVKLFSISDSAARTMRVNLGVSLAYNLSFAALAFLGYINPLTAAILMPVSSITVVALSLYSGRISNS